MFAFDSSIVEPQEFEKPAWWFVFQGQNLVVQPEKEEGESVYRPLFLPDIHDVLPQANHIHFLGALGQTPCYVAEQPAELALPENSEIKGLRRLFGQMGVDFWRIAGRAIQILDWDRNHQFCGRCATPTELTSDDRSKVCPACKLRAYPRLSPAVIMAITHNERLLLGRSSRHPQGFHSVLAGFAEPGESLEETVAREIFEEVGLKVKDIRYFGSQPWPFPDSLMIGFTCVYDSGEIELNDSEISEAEWYTIDEIPEMRPSADISIAGQLIDWFIASQKGQ
jgi:NAD+ diphosphatase